MVHTTPWTLVDTHVSDWLTYCVAGRFTHLMGIKSDVLHLYQKHKWKWSLSVLTLLYSCTCWGKSVRKHDQNTLVVHAAPRSSASTGNSWPLPQLLHDVPIHLFCACNLAQKSGILAVCIFGWVLFHQNMQATGPLARDQEYCWMRMQPPFSGRLPDFQKGAELTAGSGALWSGVLAGRPNNDHYIDSYFSCESKNTYQYQLPIKYIFSM